MNKTIKLKDLIKLLNNNQSLRLCERNWNGDLILSSIMHVGDSKYNTFLEKHIKVIEIVESCLYIYL